MKLNPIILGMLGDFYTSNTWVFIPLGIIGLLLCWFRYKLAWLVVPVNLMICVIFLAYFFDPQNYLHITRLAPKLIPVSIFWMLFSIIAPLIGTHFSWRKSKTRQANLP